MDGKVLKQLLKKHNMTQEDLAEAVRPKSNRTYINALTQKASISEDWKEKICNALSEPMTVWASDDKLGQSENDDLDIQFIPVSSKEYLRMVKIIQEQKELIDALKKK